MIHRCDGTPIDNCLPINGNQRQIRGGSFGSKSGIREHLGTNLPDQRDPSPSIDAEQRLQDSVLVAVSCFGRGFENFEQVEAYDDDDDELGLWRSEPGGRRRRILGGDRRDTIQQQQEENGAETASGRFHGRGVITRLHLELVRQESRRQFQIRLARGQGEGEKGEGLLVQPEISKGRLRSARPDRPPSKPDRQRSNLEEEHLVVAGQSDERARGEGGEEEGQAPVLVETILENGLEEGRGHGPRGWPRVEDRRDTLDAPTQAAIGDHTPARVGRRRCRGGGQRSGRQDRRGSTGLLLRSQKRRGETDSIPLVQRISRR